MSFPSFEAGGRGRLIVPTADLSAMRGYHEPVSVISYSTCIAASAMHVPLRGIIHSVFNAAANIVFPFPGCAPPLHVFSGYPYRGGAHPGGDSPDQDGFVLSLNAASTPRMPNGIQLSSPAGGFPFSALHPGMPVIFGAQRLHIEAIDCSLDLSQSPQWNPHIQRPVQLDMTIVRQNYSLVTTFCQE